VSGWRYNLRGMFAATTFVGVVIGALLVGARWFYYVQVYAVREVLDVYPAIDRVWIGTNDDVQLEVEAVFFTVRDRPGVVFRSGGIDYVGEAEFRLRLDQALRERKAVELPDYVTPLER
jgi:hypothetical protein